MRENKRKTEAMEIKKKNFNRKFSIWSKNESPVTRKRMETVQGG